MSLKPFVQALRSLDLSERLRFGLMLGARVLVQTLDILGVAVVGFLAAGLAGTLEGQPATRVFQFEIATSNSIAYVYGVTAIAGFFIAKSIVGALFLRLMTGFLGRLEARLAIDIAKFLFRDRGDRLWSLSPGDIQWAVMNSPQVGFSTILLAGSTIVTEGMLFLLMIASFVVIDFPSAVGVLVYFGLLVVGFQWFIGQRLRRLGQRISSESVAAADSVMDLARVYKEASVLEKRGFFLDVFGRSRAAVARDTSRQRFVMGVPRYFVESALIVGVAALVVGHFLMGSLANSLVVIAVFLAGGTRLMAALLPLQNAISELKIAAPKAERALQLIDESRAWQREQERKVMVAPAQHTEVLGRAGKETGLSIVVSDLQFKFTDSDRSALENIDFACKSGDFVAIVGPSGAGKTTLADLLLGILETTKGEILLGGLTPRHWRHTDPGSLAYVPQSPGLVRGSLAENVALEKNLDRRALARVDECLELAGLKGFAGKLDEGLHTTLGSGALGLSGGQIQRLGIARALFPRPRLLVLDEATSALDAETENKIALTLNELRGSLTLVVVAHRLSTVQFADSVLLIEDGHREGFGSFEELRRTKPFIDRSVDLLSIDKAENGGRR